MKIEERVRELSLELPEITKPIGNYVKYRKTGNLIYFSGVGPVEDDMEKYKGKLGKDLNIQEGYDAARSCGLNLLAALNMVVEDINQIVQIISLHGFVNCIEEFNEHPRVINGTSDLLIEIFGDKGKHSRCALGCNSLPMNIPVEVEMIVEVNCKLNNKGKIKIKKM